MFEIDLDIKPKNEKTEAAKIKKRVTIIAGRECEASRQ